MDMTELCSYEKLELEKINRNEQRLKDLGLGAAASRLFEVEMKIEKTRNKKNQTAGSSSEIIYKT